MNRAPVSYELLLNGWYACGASSWRRGKREWKRKHIGRNNGWISSKFDENYIPIDQKKLNELNKNLKKAIPRHIIIKQLKISDKKKNLKSSQIKKTDHIRTKIMITEDFLSKTMHMRRQLSNIFKKLKGKKVNLKFYAQQKYL